MEKNAHSQNGFLNPQEVQHARSGLQYYHDTLFTGPQKIHIIIYAGCILLYTPLMKSIM